ncbi:unnamed protein product [Prorocentrum cordatum]|uniref:Glutathione gamma-glutamylcysteinyltransferase n=1 Tax=Prorocentrum cordatum TaxID=2364126 RepID=A0ABN9YGC7_9DINO|nr:unnamed protein product [Polarella glacialis]
MMCVSVVLLLLASAAAETPRAIGCTLEEEDDGIGLLQSNSRNAHEQTPEKADRVVNGSAVVDATPNDTNAGLLANLAEQLAADRDRGGASYNGACTANSTMSIATCSQLAPEWCWATTAAVIAGFFQPTQEKADQDNCKAMSCRAVGNMFSQFNPAYCCGASNEDCYGNNAAAGQDDIIEAISFLSQQDYIGFDGWPLEQEALDAAVSMGYPIAFVVFWLGGGGHVLTLGGCAGDGTYYVYDPLTKRGLWQTLTYAQILHYDPGALEDSARYTVVQEQQTNQTLDSLLQEENESNAVITGGLWSFTAVLKTEATWQYAQWWAQQPGRTVFARTTGPVELSAFL